MRLEEWLFKWLSINWGEVPPDAGKEDWHVIGTCGECKWWQEYGECWNPKMYHIAPDSHFEGRLRFKKNDGCIHFKQKEGDVTCPDKSTSRYQIHLFTLSFPQVCRTRTIFSCIT